MPNLPVVACVVADPEADKYEADFAFADPAPSIAVPSVSVRSYLRSFDHTVMLARDIARIGEPVLAAWWGTPASVVAIKRHLDCYGSVDVLAAAASLRCCVTEHAVVVARAHC